MRVGNGQQLTTRERDVLDLLADGLSNREIADRLNISIRTVEAHVRGLLRKYGASRRSEVVSMWLRSSPEIPRGRGMPWLTEPERNRPWSRPLAALLRGGEYDAAFRLIVEQFESEPSWEAARDLLRVAELVGRPTAALRHYVRLVDELDSRAPTSEVRSAVAYFRGRLLSQVGLIKSALDVHSANLPPGDVLFGGPYQRRSRFEIANLAFKVEDFDTAQRDFDTLYQGLSGVESPDVRYVADVYQFCGTLAVIGILHDLPHSAALERPIDPDAARHFGRLALNLSERERYPEGIAWAQVVQAFAAEAAGDVDQAEEIWRTARRSALGLGQWSAKVNVLLYEAGFQRRRGDMDAATMRIAEAEQFLPVDHYLRLRTRILEEKAMVLRRREGNSPALRNLINETLLRYAQEPGLILLSDWPIATRLRRTCRDVRLDFGSYLLPGRSPTEEAR